MHPQWVFWVQTDVGSLQDALPKSPCHRRSLGSPIQPGPGQVPAARQHSVGPTPCCSAEISSQKTAVVASCPRWFPISILIGFLETLSPPCRPRLGIHLSAGMVSALQRRYSFLQCVLHHFVKCTITAVVRPQREHRCGGVLLGGQAPCQQHWLVLSLATTCFGVGVSLTSKNSPDDTLPCLNNDTVRVFFFLFLFFFSLVKRVILFLKPSIL